MNGWTKSDTVAVAGLLILAAGSWWIYPPAGLLVLGLGVLLLGIITDRHRRNDGRGR